MSKHVLVLSNSSDGLYGFRSDLLQALAQKGKVVVSTPNSGRFEELSALDCAVLETTIDRRGINPIADLNLFLNYSKLVRKEKPDLVITYTIKPNIYGGLVCRMQKIPYAVNITGLGTAFQKQGILRALVTGLHKKALKKAEVVFFENVENMQTLLENKVVRQAQCCVLNGAGVNTDHYAYAAYPQEEAPTRFLFIGRVMREKGVEELFCAMERLRADGYNCILDVLGEYEEDYADVIHQYEAAGWLTYHGFQTDVRPFIKESHCFVLPSYHEGMANTNLECASMGRPVITSNIHGCKESVIENISGLLCQPQDADSLYAMMKQFLCLPHQKRVDMGIAGRNHMKEVFEKQKVVEKTMERLDL